MAYVAYIDDLDRMSGVAKKIYQQSRAFSELGIPTTVFIGSRSGYGKSFKFGEVTQENYSGYFSSKFKVIRRRVFFEYIRDELSAKAYKFLYLRNTLVTPSLVRWMEKVKINCPKTIVEVPTYPYRSEFITQRKYHALILDLLLFKKLAAKTDLFALINGRNNLIVPNYIAEKCVEFRNGIDVESTKLREPIEHEAIRLVGVANVSLWHGYDRVILGLNRYYKEAGSRNIEFHIVGDGPEIEPLKNQVSQMNLKTHVKFHGVLRGAELDSIYDSSDIAVSSLGLHRVSAGDPLKSKEYCARGIPFVCLESEADFRGINFVHMVESADNAIDIRKCLHFLKSLESPKEQAKKMRLYASSKLTWKTRMRSVVEKIREIA